MYACNACLHVAGSFYPKPEILNPKLNHEPEVFMVRVGSCRRPLRGLGPERVQGPQLKRALVC